MKIRKWGAGWRDAKPGDGGEEGEVVVGEPARLEYDAHEFGLALKQLLQAVHPLVRLAQAVLLPSYVHLLLFNKTNTSSFSEFRI
jgi:hypothetical protein